MSKVDTQKLSCNLLFVFVVVHCQVVSRILEKRDWRRLFVEIYWFSSIVFIGHYHCVCKTLGESFFRQHRLVTSLRKQC